MSERGNIFARGKSAAEVAEAEAKAPQARERIARLAENADFADWLYGVLDDLCGFARDEGMLTDFGQGIRAAANHIRNSLLVDENGMRLLVRLTEREIEVEYARAKAARQISKQNEKETD